MRSRGWQSSALQIASSVEKRIARAFPVFSVERLARVMLTSADSSVNVILRSINMRSK